MIATDNGAESQRLFESITSESHKVDLTRPARKSPTAEERATWGKSVA
jgi:hypothetical protein